MKVYIATSLENHEAHRTLALQLRASGHMITYDWTLHGPVWRDGLHVIRETACNEFAGVRTADVVVVLLPGGRGTHAELGMALGFGIPVLICSNVPEHFQACPQTCAFYHHPLVRTFTDQTKLLEFFAS